METKIKINHLSRIWTIDKYIIKQYNPQFDINWNADMPTEQDAKRILLEKFRIWKSPSNPVELNSSNLELLTDNLIQELEQVWKTKLKDKLDFEIMTKNNYLFKLNILAGEVNSLCGFGRLYDSPPTLFMSPYHGKVLIPERFLVRVVKGNQHKDPYNSLFSSDFKVEELEWDKPFLESVLCETIVQCLFRQERCEWKEDYVRTMKALGPDKKLKTEIIKDVLVQYTREKLTTDNHKDWSLYTVADKLHSVWDKRNKQICYLGLLELAKEYPLNRIALIDEIYLINKGIGGIHFFTEYPSYQEKNL